VKVLPQLGNPSYGLASTLQDNSLIVAGGHAYGEDIATVQKLDLGYGKKGFCIITGKMQNDFLFSFFLSNCFPWS
jgi:hypothetical protein